MMATARSALFALSVPLQATAAVVKIAMQTASMPERVTATVLIILWNTSVKKAKVAYALSLSSAQGTWVKGCA